MDGDYPSNISLIRNDLAIRARIGSIFRLSLSCSAVIIYLILLYIVCQGKYSAILALPSHLL
jgi:hypothetical protein